MPDDLTASLHELEAKRLDADRIRRDFPMLEKRMNGRPLVYLDSAATSQKPRVMIDRLYTLYAEEYAKVEEGHALSKMGGPSSVGFLYGMAKRMEAEPIADGGSTMCETLSFERIQAKPLPHKYEAGEPAFGEAVAWGPAIDYWMELGMERIAAYEKALTCYATARLAGIPGVRVLGESTDRIAVRSFTVEGIPPKEVEKELDRRGIAARAGGLDATPMLKHFGVSEAVRASFMFYNTRDKVDVLAEAVEEIARLH